MDLGLTDEVAIVTGAVGGMGEATARMLANEGAKVVLADIRDEQGEELAAEFEDAVYVHTDVTSRDEISALVDEAVATYDTVDILVNTVGLPGRYVETAEDWDEQFAVHVRGVADCMREVTERVMIPNEYGKVVNVSSLAAHGGGGGLSAYAAAKAGVSRITKGSARELGRHGINVNCVSPGVVESPMTEGGAFSDPDRIEQLESDIVFDRLAELEDIAYPIVFVSEPTVSTGTPLARMVWGNLLNRHTAFRSFVLDVFNETAERPHMVPLSVGQSLPDIRQLLEHDHVAVVGNCLCNDLVVALCRLPPRPTRFALPTYWKPSLLEAGGSASNLLIGERGRLERITSNCWREAPTPNPRPDSVSPVTDEPYRTVAGRGECRFEVRGSEFIGHATPVRTVDEAESFVAAVREEYPDASHSVPTYRVRANPLREWASDDGEPTSSAGKPALNVLEQEELENVAVVVTRYYGGTNLGVGGLARAYSRAARDAIEDAGITTERPHERFSVTVEYDDSGTVRGILESEGVEFDAEYAETVSFDVRVPVRTASDLRDRIRSATSGRADLDC